MRIGLVLEVDIPEDAIGGLTKTGAKPTAAQIAAVRLAVLKRLPKHVHRVIAILPLKHLEAIMLLHEAVGTEVMGKEPFVRPPADYVPPTRD